LRVFKTKWFARFARQEGLTDEKLAAAIQEIENGLNDGELGGGLVKKRIARSGAGKRGGYRTIVAFHAKKRAIFVYGFAKSAVDNLDALELKNYQKLAQILLRFSDADMEKAMNAGELREVDDNAEEL
jgi:hypothetical protein